MASRTLRSSRKPDAGQQDTVERPAKKRRVGKANSTTSRTSKSTVDSSKSQWNTYRVREIPDTYDESSFHGALCVSLQIEQHTTLTIHSFASNNSQQRFSTITFSSTPTRLCSAGATAVSKTTEWRVDIIHPLSRRSDTICIDTHFRGFTPISPLMNDEEHSIDCIAIHGWGSHPLGGFKAHDDSYVWLRDSLPKDVPQLRIFLYGYECDLTTDESISTVYDYADDLMRLLRDMRGHERTRSPVPLVFIAHSLGGIVLKQAIIRMKKSPDSNDLDNLNSIYGVLFFGVPSQGMNIEALAAMVRDNPQRYDLYLLGKEIGHRLRHSQHEDFCQAFDFKDSKIIQFFETKKTPTVAENPVTKKWARTGPKEVLVDPASATFGRSWETSDDFKVGIHANHSDMVKFSKFDRDSYSKAKYELQKFAEEAMLVIERRLRLVAIDKLSLYEERGKAISLPDRTAGHEDNTFLRSLAFPEMNYRRHDARKAHRNTCSWIASHASYTTWLKEGRGILWVKGKPGSGKSTLMEFLLRDFEAQDLYKNSIQLSSFFHGRGITLQKSRLGMYRSLLHQLFSNAPYTQAGFRHAFQERFRTYGDPGTDWDWHTNELRDSFISAIELVTRTQQVNIFVDALDEANDGTGDQDTSHQIVRDFHQLNDLIHRRKLLCTICFSCRHFPVIADKEGRDICVERENRADISTYVCDELCRRLFISTDENKYLADLQNTIIKGAEGVFQWAALVVDLAIRYHNNGKPLRKIRQMLSEVPKELEEVYKHILSEVIDKYDYLETLRLMRLVYLAERPLSVEEAAYAMAVPDTEIYDLEFTLATLDLPAHDVMVRRIVSLSGGLVELKQHEAEDEDKNYLFLQFTHQSVNDFLLRDGLRFLDRTSSGDPIGQGHHQLSLICANYEIMAGVGNSNDLDAESIKAQFPFVSYATKSWFLHVEKAENRGVLQEYLLRYSQHCPHMLEQWVRIYRIIHEYNERRPEWSSTMLHIASGANLLSVAEDLLLADLDLEQTDGKGNRAIHLASRWGHTKVVKALLGAGALINAQNNDMKTPLVLGAANGHEEIVRLLLAKGADVSIMTGSSGNALCSATLEGRRAIVQFLLSHKADVNAQGGEYGNALQAAAYNGSQAIVQLLLDNKAEVNAQGGRYGNALQAAAARGNQAAVQLLLNSKADVNAQGGYYGNALQAAACDGPQVVVQLLLDNRAEVNAQGGNYGNALQAAARFGYQAVVKLLLDSKAEVDDRVIQAAKDRENEEIIKLLIEYKAKAEAEALQNVVEEGRI